LHTFLIFNVLFSKVQSTPSDYEDTEFEDDFEDDLDETEENED